MAVSYAVGDVADKTFAVSAFRYLGLDGSRPREVEVRIGDLYFGQEVLSVDFYTGFAGCPARYFVTTTRSTTIVIA